MRFLGLSLGDDVPDAKTIWLFREQLTEAGVIEKAFEQFETYLCEQGFSARKGQIVDASIVPVPKQRNSREENQRIKQGEIPEDWSEQKKRQKDTDARWTKKNGQNYYGYKNHIDVDVKHKLIRSYEVTPASVHDSQVFEDLLDEDNSSRDVWADSAYRSEEKLKELKKRKYREHLQRKGCRHKTADGSRGSGESDAFPNPESCGTCLWGAGEAGGKADRTGHWSGPGEGQGWVEESGLQFGSILRGGGDMSPPSISTGQNDPVGSLTSDQKIGSDRFRKMNDRVLCLTFSLNSIQRISNFQNSHF